MPRRPRNQIQLRRMARSGGVAAGLSLAAGAIARGVRTAYKNRQAIQDTTRLARKGYDRLVSNWKSKRLTPKYTSETVGQEYGGGNDYTRSRARVGRAKKPTVQRLNRMVRAGMNNQIYRFQNITNFDTNVGAFPLCNWQFTTGQVQLPVHVYDLTSFNNNAAHSPGHFFQWTTTAASAPLIRGNLPGQAPDGTTGASTWNIETKGGTLPTTSFPNATKMMHNWTDVRLLLYGARKRTTRFDVMFIRVKDEFANPANAALNNAELKEFMQYLERPCIYSPLQSLTGGRVSKRMSVVKRFTYYISAAQTTDVDTTVGKTREARIFLRHDKIYNMEFKHWNEDGTDVLPHEQVDGLDYDQDTKNHNHPWHSSQLFMVIRATAPQRVTGKTAYPVAGDAEVDPSYDIIIRNSVSTPA